ncbi:uncharacterized protein [Rutidosis leptorrhynchoides]|uniref:uncharacterized protein n=1 Tax=Rutidosis leptorrhynchoides TaxID=125765 RepID=UPI003A9A27DA
MDKINILGHEPTDIIFCNDKKAKVAAQKKDKVRGRTTNNTLRDAWKKHEKKPLDIEFDVSDQKTGSPLGDNGPMLVSLIGSIVGALDYPFYYDKWTDVPSTKKTSIWPQIHQYFDMRPWLDGSEREALVKAGIEATCASRYSDAKSAFKRKYWTDRDALDAPDYLRNDPPEGFDSTEWGKFVDWASLPKNLARAQQNRENRAKQPYPSRHGRKSIVSRRAARLAKDPEKPLTLIDDWEDRHTDDLGNWDGAEKAREQHEEMKELRRLKPNLSEEKIFVKVLGFRRGHNRGRGRKLPQAAVSQMSSGSYGSTSRTPEAPPSTCSGCEQLTHWVTNFVTNNQNVGNLHLPDYPLATNSDAPGPSGSHNEDLDEESDEFEG